MKNLKLLILCSIITVSCSSSKFINSQGSFTLEGQSYFFSDSGVRNVQITFISDSLVRVTNRVSELSTKNYYLYNFTNDYKVSVIDGFRYKIGDVVNESHSLNKQKYILPYRRGSIIDRSNIFPSVENDTLFFNETFERVQLKEFSFGIRD